MNKVIEFMVNKQNGNCHEEKVKKSEIHQHRVDIKLVGGVRSPDIQDGISNMNEE